MQKDEAANPDDEDFLPLERARKAANENNKQPPSQSFRIIRELGQSISGICIQGFFPFCSRVRLPIGALSVLIGENGAGKTSVWAMLFT